MEVNYLGSTVRKLIWHFLMDNSAMTAIGYGLIAAAISVVIAAVVGNTFTSVSNSH